ncbi:MAG: beta-propeller domain-containing protein [Candidatus Izemoplasma sp.]|nr:beta-propeller domain-containing protein [Candidatus Izemoplasma sp.]
MSTLFNQPGLLFLLIVFLGISLYFVKRFIDEYQWNKRLDKKKTAMRISSPDIKRNHRLSLLLTGAVSPVILVIVALVATVNLGGNNYDVVDFNSGDDILDIYNAFEQNYRTNNGWFFTDGLMVPETTTDNFDTVNEDQGSDDYSNTNNQVIGVDEMDNVLTDGKYIYVARNNEVKIVLAYTQSETYQVLDLETSFDYSIDDQECPRSFNTNGLYVDDDYLAVIGSYYNNYCYEDKQEDDIVIDWWGYQESNINVFVYDKKDNFSLETIYELSGNFLGTRKIEDNLYVVTSTYLPLYQEDVDVDKYLPYYKVNNMSVQAKYQNIVYVDGVAPNSFTTFYGLDLGGKQVDMEVILGDSAYNLYVSQNNMYLAGTLWPYRTFTDDLLSNDNNDVQTAIFKIKIDGPNVAFDKYGKVPGNTLNQFSMDEYEGVLRIATTSGRWTENINNQIFLLDSELKIINKIGGLGKPGEVIRSVRFTKDYAYVVTFEQTDPFYVLNLSDPSNPTVLGELEITGFSSYLQPLGNDYMLGIGFGDSEGGTEGIKISVYDIKDKTNPVVFDEIIYDYADFGWSYTTATYNHKDLLVSLSKGLIALPFTTYDYLDDRYQYNSGILTFGFDEIEGLSVKGYVQHASNTEEEVYVYKAKFIHDEASDTTFFYTVSNRYIKVSTLNDPTTILESLNIE